MRCALALLAAALVLAGCSSSAPTTISTEAQEPRPPATEPARAQDANANETIVAAARAPARVVRIVGLEVSAQDGAILRGHAYLPEGPGPFATILGFGPYWGNEFPATGEMMRDGRLRAIYDDETYARLSEAGFAVAIFNVRGTGESGGCFGFFNPVDGADGAAIVEALAAATWSDGRVGMYGVSYDGWTQYAAMAHRPPHLLATAPVSGILDLWSVSTRHGAMVRIYAGAGTLYTWGTALDGNSILSGGGTPGPPSPRAAHVCADGARETVAVDAVVLDGDRSAAFRARDLRDAVRASGIPAFATYGLAQPDLDADGRATPSEGLVMNAQNLSADLPPGSRILVGPWAHGPPSLESFPDEVVAWFDARLRGGPEPPDPVRFQEKGGAWHAPQRWPPAADILALPMDAGARLASSNRPPTLALCGPDQAVFAWPPLEQDALLAGAFRVEVEVTATAPDGNFAAWLFAFRGERPCEAEEVRGLGRAHTDLRHRGHLETGAEFPIARPASIDVASAPFAARVSAGERLALVLSGGDALTLQPKAEAPLLLLGAGTLSLPVAAWDRHV